MVFLENYSHFSQYVLYYLSIKYAPIAQGIERRSPEPGAQVRFLLGAP